MTPAPTAMPNSEEAERAVLGALLIEPQRWHLLRHLLSLDEVFYSDRNRLTWQAMGRVIAAGQSLDLRTVEAELQAAGHWEQVGGMAYLAGLDFSLPASDAGSVESYARILKDRLAKRRMIALAHRMASEAHNGSGSAELITDIGTALHAISTEAQDRADGVDAVELLEDFDPYAPSIEPGIPSGLQALDALTLGWRPGQLVVLAGRPGQGKTSLAVQLSRYAAAHGRKVRLYSLEMTKEDIRDVVIAQASGVPLPALRTRAMTPHQAADVGKSIVRETDHPGRLTVCDRPRLTTDEIAAGCTIDALRRGLDLVVVDYLGLLGYHGRQIHKRDIYGEHTKALRAMAKELRVPVVLLAQLNRESAKEKRLPALEDLRDSGEIEQDADTVVFIARRAAWYPPDGIDGDGVDWNGIAELIVAKHRGGPIGLVRVAFQAERVAFFDLSTRQEAPL